MKWLASHTKVEYPDKATRLQRRFAWLPVYIAGKYVWLEFYEVLQLHELQTFNVLIEEKLLAFKTSQWINISKRIIE